MANFQAVNFGLVCALMGLTGFLLVQSITHPNQFLKKYLSVFYAANLINQIDELLWLQKAWIDHSWLVNLYIPFLYLIAPSFYQYAKGLTQPQGSHRFFQWQHWLGFVLALGACLPYFLLDGDIKLQRLQAPAGTLEHLSYITYAPMWTLILFIPFTFVYLLMILRLLSSHLNNIKAYFSNIENKDLSWLRWSIIILFLAYVVSVVQLFLPASITERPQQHQFFMLFEFIWLTVIGIFAIQQKSIRLTVKKITKHQPIGKYARSQITQAESDKIKKQLLDAMQQQHLHRNPLLTLRYLSDYLKVSENRISQVLNAEIQQGFYDFINACRIKDACEMIKTSNKNLLDIAYAVGFNSRSTFNTAFKKHSKDTPSGYRKKHKQT